MKFERERERELLDGSFVEYLICLNKLIVWRRVVFRFD